MKPVEIVTSEERAVWLERQTELRKHNLVKCNYYPNKLDEWAEKSKEIMREYNFQLHEMNKNRKETNKNQNEIKITRINKRKRTSIEENNKEPLRRSGRIAADSVKQKENIAVEALLSLRIARL
jgi:hypothetical protein|tara:strand:- start:1289 stop:1660 length:372 start_codon:yes stop_codon:yes gene_type:complete